MDDLRELYQTTILDHNKNPRNFQRPEGANCEASGHNPLCGDKLVVYADIENDRVVDIGFRGEGCAISTASASLMTEYAKGRTRSEIEKTFDRFHELVAGNPSEPARAPELGKLEVFAGVREFPMRVKCATLAWHTLRAALSGEGEPVKTE